MYIVRDIVRNDVHYGRDDIFRHHEVHYGRDDIYRHLMDVII